MKQVILIRTDLGMSVGKMIAQACHASVKAAICAKEGVVDDDPALSETFKAWYLAWDNDLYKKIVLGVTGNDELLHYYLGALDHLPCFIVTDAGLTELPPNTETAVAIGPAPDELINKITGDLKVLKNKDVQL